MTEELPKKRRGRPPVEEKKSTAKTVPNTERPELLEIHERFFVMLEYLLQNGVVKNFNSFAIENEIKTAHLYQMRLYPKRYLIPGTLLSLVIKKYDISGDWLMAGIGEMLRK
ncbi:hypothetical protein [Dyadobacter sp. LHD-138]|uniref:hypothetical protein n=1 Tax=Dyadobacter sp. LHD-138 TaxID=3071413 RepID=UPI0027DEE083|nr:hypothetical protein [Dyadobacter sp. LHD-138]MDQ6477848.1 hypothetical protein [Dyadobacter sp. LHD-138]